MAWYIKDAVGPGVWGWHGKGILNRNGCPGDKSAMLSQHHHETWLFKEPLFPNCPIKTVLKSFS